MIKSIFCLSMAILLVACSSSSPKIKPLQDEPLSFQRLPVKKIDQKSYAIAYETTIASYQGRVKPDYFVNSFARGVNDWYQQLVTQSPAEIKEKIYQKSGLSLKQHTYYSGILLAANLQNNLQQLKKGCWQKIQPASLVEGIYDAMADLKKGQPRPDDDPYLVQGTNQILKFCTK